jgi:hypothetical protein
MSLHTQTHTHTHTHTYIHTHTHMQLYLREIGQDGIVPKLLCPAQVISLIRVCVEAAALIEGAETDPVTLVTLCVIVCERE